MSAGLTVTGRDRRSPLPPLRRADPLPPRFRNDPLVYLRQRDRDTPRTTAAHEEILPANWGGDALADPAQDLVTGLVAEAIVPICLEVIEIQHDEAGGVLPCTLVVILVEEVAVVEAGD